MLSWVSPNYEIAYDAKYVHRIIFRRAVTQIDAGKYVLSIDLGSDEVPKLVHVNRVLGDLDHAKRIISDYEVSLGKTGPEFKRPHYYNIISLEEIRHAKREKEKLLQEQAQSL